MNVVQEKNSLILNWIGRVGFGNISRRKSIPLNLILKNLNLFSTLQPKPRPFQKRGGKRNKNWRNKYKEYLSEDISKNEKDLKKFKNKKVLLYLCFYLRKRNFEQSDIDNYVELIMDALKCYIGDDKNVVNLIVDKKMLYEEYDPSDLDFLENTLVLVSEPLAKKDIVISIS
jgi:Holliday junction resolvase RusA-like endonuclease